MPSRRVAFAFLFFACGGTKVAPTALTVPVAPVAPIAPIAPSSLAPPFTPAPGTVALAVTDANGNIATNDEAPAELHYAAIVAACHAPGRASGHVVLRLEEADDSGHVRVAGVGERAGLDDATIKCLADAIDHAVSPRTLAGTLTGHSLADGGWARGAGSAYVTLY